MGISAFGASGIKPGVCTSTTRPSSPYEGMMIYETDTNRVLVWDNAAWVMIADTDAPPGAQHIKTTTFSGSTSVDVTSCLSSDFVNYRALLRVKGSATAGLYLRALTGTTTVETSTLYSISMGVQYSVGTVGASTRGDQYMLCGAVAATYFSDYSIDIYSPNEATYTNFVVHGTFQRSATDHDSVSISARNAVTTQLTGFQLTAAGSANIDGTIRVYGYRN